jgi:hypothetical protein
MRVHNFLFDIVIDTDVSLKFTLKAWEVSGGKVPTPQVREAIREVIIDYCKAKGLFCDERRLHPSD